MVRSTICSERYSAPNFFLYYRLKESLTEWTGPYASAILRFQIRFPPQYPNLPPQIIFNTDIFHPLVVPLTTFTFTTNSSDTDTVSATDEERLPPGGFSLRHGFPHWFGRTRRSGINSGTSSRNVSTNDLSNKDASQKTSKDPKGSNIEAADLESVSTLPGCADSPQSRLQSVPIGKPYASSQVDIPIATILNYVRSTFDNEDVLDSIPLEAAGNPGAWHAWRSHRKSSDEEKSSSSPRLEGGNMNTSSPPKKRYPQARSPGEWNWEGVWIKRVQSGIQTSYLESVLFGSTPRGGDDLVSSILVYFLFKSENN